MGQVIELHRVHPERRVEVALRDEGNLAWKRLQRMGRARRKLSPQDRAVLARRLHLVIEDLFCQRPGLKRGAFASMAGLGETSKELHYLTLAPQEESEAAVRLRADAERYFRVVTAVHKTLGIDLDAFLYEFTLGTSIHPSSIDPVRVEGDETLLEAVTRIGQRVADEFGLPGKFLRTAHARSQALRDGSQETWPYHAGVVDALPGRGAAVDESDPRLVLPDHAFWPPGAPRPVKAGGAEASAHAWLADSALAFLPHAHLAMYWDEGFRPDARTAWQCEQEYGGYSLPITGSTRLDCEPRRVVRDPASGKPTYRWQVAQPATIDYWLVLYPSKDLAGVTPLLWSASGDYAWQRVEVEPLSLTTLEKLRRIPALAREPRSLYQCLRELLGDGDEERIPLLDRWRESAPNVEENPFLETDRANQRLAAKLARLLDREAHRG